MALSCLHRATTVAFRIVVLALCMGVAPRLLCAQRPMPRDTGTAAGVTASRDSVTVHLVDADLRAVVQALAPYLDRPVIFGSAVPGTRVTLETPHPVARSAVLDLLTGVLTSQNLELATDTVAGLYRVQPRAPPPVAAAPAEAESTPRIPAGPIQLYIIHLRHARAADVAATVNALFGRASSLGDIGSTRPPTLDQQLQSSMMQPAGSVAPAQQANASASPIGSAAGRSATLAGDVTIVPDQRSNSLFIRASQSDYDLITSAVQELDTRPLQVLIEVIIAEVEKTNSLQFGVDATLPPTRVNGGKTVLNGSQVGAGLSDFVLHAMNLTGLNIDATLTAAAERGDVRILSRPILVAANNQPATINVGSQRPFIQLARTLPTDNASVDQVVQYKDVGTKLSVVPTISPDGYVGLEVTQEIDNATQEVAFDAPVISTRSIQTELLIKDGQTVALGGFTDNERDITQGGIPFLSSIPLLGGLFGHSSHQTTATEIYLFLTPHVIRSDEDADSVTHPMLDRAGKVKP
ncbi:MAG: type II secretion system protein GspD [Gemmatimonadaceae bacterium]